MSEPKNSIEIKNLTRSFIVSHELKAAYKSVQETIVDLVTFKGLRQKSVQKEEFKALKGINLEVAQGEVVGIIGRNGSGKSTLLKVISRVLEPTEGQVTIRGRLASLLEVGTGFHPELTGRENIYFNASILGMTQQEIEERIESIIEFSEIAHFIDTPVKFYSSGMYVRLAFSVAVHVDPDILIIDEVLSVGDAKFQAKSKKKIRELLKSNKTVLFVSHNMPIIEDLCNKAILLEEGKIIAEGAPSDVVAEYLTSNAPGGKIKKFENRRGAGGINVKSLELVGQKGKKLMSLKHGDDLHMKLHLSKLPKDKAAKNVKIDVRIFDTLNNWVTSYTNDQPIEITGKEISLTVPTLKLTEGGYVCSVFIYSDNNILQDVLGKAFTFAVKDESLKRFTGIRQQVVVDSTLKVTQNK